MLLYNSLGMDVKSASVCIEVPCEDNRQRGNTFRVPTTETNRLNILFLFRYNPKGFPFLKCIFVTDLRIVLLNDKHKVDRKCLVPVCKRRDIIKMEKILLWLFFYEYLLTKIANLVFSRSFIIN